MAVEVEKETNWFSSELSILEAEFEKSKVQVYQDTLLCKRSMVELDLLWKNERLRKNVRVNNKLKEKDSKLQEQLKSLSSELENATSQLQTAQNSLQDEKTRHQLEKKELEQKLNSEMEAKMEQQRESAIKRENLLQEELKTLQNKHFKISKEADDLRTELSKKNVAVKTKAVQARVNVKNTSTMVQVDSQTCEAGVQVQDMALAHDRSRMDGDDDREVNEDLRETSETSKEKKRVTEAKGKARKRETVKGNKKDTDKRKNLKAKKKIAKDQTVQTCEEVDEDEGEENGMFHEEGDNGRRVLRKRKSSQREGAAPQSEAKAMAEKQQTVASTQEELHQVEQTTNKAQTDKSAANVLQEYDDPFQYSITPRRLQKLQENNQSLEKHDTTSGNTQDDMACSKEEGNNSTKRSEVTLKECHPLENCVEDNSNKEVLENAQNDFEVNKDGFVAMPLRERPVENENVRGEEQENALIEEVNDVIEINEAGIKLHGEEELAADSEKTDADEGIQSHELPGVKDMNEEMRKNGKKESKRKRKAKQMKSAEEEIQEHEGKIQEQSAVKSSESQGKRVLRSKVKECHSGVQPDTKKGEKRKVFGPKTRQKRQDSVVETAVTKKCKPDGWDLKGRELTMLDKSTPEADQLPRETDMSSREIDRLVDELRPSRVVMTPTPASDETSQQPEPEVLRRSNEGNTSSQGESLGDYTSDQGRLVLNVNRISTLEETIFDNCLHKHAEEGKSPCHNGLHPDQQNDNKVDLCSKTTNIAPSAQQFQDTDDISASKKQDSYSSEADCNTHLTRQTAQSTSRDTGRSRRNGQDPAEVSVIKAASSKENASNGKLKSRKKRKPTSSVREVLAPADQQSNSDCRTSSIENPSMLDCTKRRKTLFNSRENSLMVPVSNTQISSANTTLSKGRANAGIPPSLSAFMRSFIAPKLKKPT